MYLSATSKGQKLHKFTDNEKEEIVNYYLSANSSLQDVGNKFDISRKTVYSMFKEYRNIGSVKSIKKTGKLQKRDLKKKIEKKDMKY